MEVREDGQGEKEKRQQVRMNRDRAIGPQVPIQRTRAPRKGTLLKQEIQGSGGSRGIMLRDSDDQQK